MLGIGLGVLMFTIDTSAVNIVLPTLVQTLHTSFTTIQWVVLSYLLVITALVLGRGTLRRYVWEEAIVHGRIGCIYNQFAAV